MYKKYGEEKGTEQQRRQLEQLTEDRGGSIVT